MKLQFRVDRAEGSGEMSEEMDSRLTEEILELRLLALQAISEGDLDRARRLRTQLFAIVCDTKRLRDPEGIASLRSVDRFLIPALEAATDAEPSTQQRGVRRPRLTRLRLGRRPAG